VTLIQVNPDPLRIGYNAPAEIGIIGGVGPVCHQLLETVRAKTEKRAAPAWGGRAADLVKEVERPFTETYADDSIPMNPGRCAYEVSRFLDEEGRDWNAKGGRRPQARPDHDHGTPWNPGLRTGIHIGRLGCQW